MKLYVCGFTSNEGYTEQVVASDNRGQAATGVPRHVIDWADRYAATLPDCDRFEIGTFTPVLLTARGVDSIGQVTWLFDSADRR